MFDLLQAQLDLFGAVCSHAPLANANVVLERKMQLQSEVERATAWSTTRNGRAGLSILTEMPIGKNQRPNVSGPTLDFIFSFLIIEQCDVNMVAETGTNVTAEDAVLMMMDCVHHHADDTVGTWESSGFDAVTEIPGCVAYRVSFKVIAKAAQTRRCGTVVITLDGSNNCTLACAADPTADIFYTTDESFPGNLSSGNVASQPYAGPFPVVSGQVVRAAAWIADKNGSEVRRLLVP